MALKERTLSDHERTLEVPDAKIQAILRLMDQVLDTEGDEARDILMAIRGRKGRKTQLTFGGFRNIVSVDAQGLEPDAQKLNDALMRLGIDDLGSGPPVEFVRLAVLITPDLEVCDACGKYAVDTRGGKPSMLMEGRCPHRGCDGLITPVEQGKPYDPWTHPVPGEFPWAQTHDMRDPAHHWPTRHDAIMADIETSPGSFDNLKMVMKQEGLIINEGEFKGGADVCQWLLWLNRNGNRQAGSGTLDDVYASLTDQSVLGRRIDMTTLRQYCREAKQFRSGSSISRRAPVSVPTPAPASSIPLSGSRTQQVEQLLTHLFQAKGINGLRQFLKPALGLQPEWLIRWNGHTFSSAVRHLTQVMEQKQLMTSWFFNALGERAGMDRPAVDQVRKLWLPEVEQVHFDRMRILRSTIVHSYVSELFQACFSNGAECAEFFRRATGNYPPSYGEGNHYFEAGHVMGQAASYSARDRGRYAYLWGMLEAQCPDKSDWIRTVREHYNGDLFNN